ncbi:hypothetical protein T484DRAFT_1913524 [Baffinella frigidus]|nr:hypothetical protein T484DRAFT_1913524 [Cryptophyta sp. CCMP2293]
MEVVSGPSRWNTANPAHGDQNGCRSHIHDHLLINDKPLESYSPLGAPEPSQQGAALVAVVALAFLQGVAWGCSEVIQVKLGGICSVAGAPPPPPPNARLDVWPCLALTSGSALLLVSPLAALLVHRKIKNADVQLIALGVWLGSAVLLLSVGVVSPESFGSSDSASSGESAISGGSVSSTGVGGDHAVVVEVVAWVGIVINASCLAVLRPLLAILTADQVRDPVRRGKAVGMAYCFLVLGASLGWAGASSAGSSSLLAILSVHLAALFLASLLLVAVKGRLVSHDNASWAASSAVEMLASANGESSAEAGARSTDASSARGLWASLCDLVFYQSSAGNQTGGEPGTVLREFVKLFMLAGSFRALAQQSVVWGTQAESMSHQLCVGMDKNSTSEAVAGAGPSASVDAAGETCFAIDEDAIWLASRICGLLLVLSVEAGGCSWIKWWAQRGVHRTVWHLYVGYGLLFIALCSSLLVQAAVDFTTGGGVSVLWQLPQWILLTVAETVVVIAGAEYSVGVAGLVSRTGAASTLFALQGAGTLLGTGVLLALGADAAGGRGVAGVGGAAHLSAVACLAAALFALQRYLWPPQ